VTNWSKFAIFLCSYKLSTGLLLFDSWVICALVDHDRFLDAVGEEQWRASFERLLASFGINISSDHFDQVLVESEPVGWNSFEQGNQIRRSEDVNSTGEGVWSEGQSDEGRVASVASSWKTPKSLNFLRYSEPIIAI